MYNEAFSHSTAYRKLPQTNVKTNGFFLCFEFVMRTISKSCYIMQCLEKTDFFLFSYVTTRQIFQNLSIRKKKFLAYLCSVAYLNYNLTTNGLKDILEIKSSLQQKNILCLEKLCNFMQ